jgi:hypothetical protein
MVANLVETLHIKPQDRRFSLKLKEYEYDQIVLTMQ